MGRKSLYLDVTTKDLTLKSDDSLRVTENNVEFISQKIEQRLQFALGEWFLNRELGIPYYTDILVKSPNLNIVNNIFREAITDIEEIDEIISFETSFDTTERSYTVNFEVKANGESVTSEVLV